MYRFCINCYLKDDSKMNENELRKQILVGKTEYFVFTVMSEMKSAMERIADKKLLAFLCC